MNYLQRKNLILLVLLIFELFVLLNCKIIDYLKFLDNQTDVVFATSIYQVATIKNLNIVTGEYNEKAIAFIKFTPGLTVKGWDFIALSSYQSTDERYSDDLKSNSMVYLEGVITYEKFMYHYSNQKRYYFFNQSNFEMPKRKKTFLT